jgi:3-dehydroquinate synthase
MLRAADLSRRLGWLQADVPERLKALLRRAKLPVAPPPAVDARRMRELMKVDKKARSGGLRLVLLQDLGRAVVTPDYGEAHLKETLERFAAGQAEVQ